MKTPKFLSVLVLLAFAQISVAANKDSCNSGPEQLVTCALSIARNWPTMSVEQVEKIFDLEIGPKQKTIPHWTYHLAASNSDIGVVVSLPGTATPSHAPFTLFQLTVYRSTVEELCITPEIIQQQFGPEEKSKGPLGISPGSTVAASQKAEVLPVSVQLPRRRQIDYILRSGVDENASTRVLFLFSSREPRCSSGIQIYSIRRSR